MPQTRHPLLKEDAVPEKKAGWMNLAERAKRGDYDLIEPLDYMILDALPDEGELVMNYYPLAASSNQLIKEKFKGMTAGQIGSSLSRMRIQGLTVKVKTRSVREYGYQRTKVGKQLLDKWKASRAPDMSGGKGGKKP